MLERKPVAKPEVGLGSAPAVLWNAQALKALKIEKHAVLSEFAAAAKIAEGDVLWEFRPEGRTPLLPLLGGWGGGAPPSLPLLAARLSCPVVFRSWNAASLLGCDPVCVVGMLRHMHKVELAARLAEGADVVLLQGALRAVLRCRREAPSILLQFPVPGRQAI